MEQVFSPQEILSLTRNKYSKVIRDCNPLFTLFEITNACNSHCKYSMLDCKYCSLECPPSDDELTTQEVYSLINNIAQGGTVSLCLTGGEPTLRKDLLQIIAHASGRMQVTLITNGVLLDQEYVRKLKRAGISWIKVYLDSPEAEVHDSLRGDGTHHKALQALKNCKILGITSSIVVTLTPMNYERLREMIRLSLELRACIETTEFLPVDGINSENNLILTKEQRKQAQKYLLEGQRLLGREKILFGHYSIISEDEEGLKIWADPSKKDTNVGYPWGIYGYGIKANGKMVPDPLIAVEVGDLKKQKLSELWEKSVLIKTLRHRGRLNGKCGKCEYKFICGGHRGRAYLLGGDFMDEDPACWYEPQLS